MKYLTIFLFNRHLQLRLLYLILSDFFFVCHYNEPFPERFRGNLAIEKIKKIDPSVAAECFDKITSCCRMIFFLLSDTFFFCCDITCFCCWITCFCCRICFCCEITCFCCRITCFCCRITCSFFAVEYHVFLIEIKILLTSQVFQLLIN